MLKPMLIIAALVAAAPGALAHGPGGHGSHGHTQELAYGKPGDPAKPAREIVVDMIEKDGRMLFVPERIEVKVGEQVRFRLRNLGELEHEFILGTAEEIDEHAELMRAMPEMDHDDPNGKKLSKKTEGDLVWHFTQAGEFEFACLIPGHREVGMAGTIVVR
ncbi:MAG TPA: cupredoxin family protein [Hyphomicrobiaceae bacterium]|nr:cupredoxin family protein [Hyphomicrobiaceae bacterium]